jgi:hypothetical protein
LSFTPYNLPISTKDLDNINLDNSSFVGYFLLEFLRFSLAICIAEQEGHLVDLLEISIPQSTQVFFFFDFLFPKVSV